MSDERRYLRLLRLNDPHKTRGEEKALGHSEATADLELKTRLSSWDVPDTPRALDQRVLASYRAVQAARPPLWRRALTSSVPVPLPIAGLAVVALIVASIMLALRPARITLESPPVAPPLAATRVVEVPVTQERIVTRTVFVEKKERLIRKKEQRGAIAARGVNAGDDSASRAKEQTGYFTRVNMTEFQPANEMKIKVIKGNRSDEK
jgi:hypothetical protein